MNDAYKAPTSGLFGKILFITLASFVGTEFLTGATPVFPSAWLSPAFLIVIVLYGSGVLLIREATVIWKKGWLTILSFGVAYAIIEEGIFAKTWFAALPITYGKWLGVNWSFGIAETIVEALFSIALPIALSRVAFSGSETERWLSNKSLATTGLTYLFVVGLGFVSSIHEYTQITLQLPLALFMITALIYIGCRIGSPLAQIPSRGALASPKMLALLYFGFTLVTFLLAPLWMTPAPPHPLPPSLAGFLAIIVLILMFSFLHKTSFSNRQLFAIVSGIASVMFLVSIFGPQNRVGAPFGVIMYLGLLAIAWRGMRH
ncbi:MAG: hypothetical protein HQM08_01580 [Candidatus Riflebacteria bacterium]|nr:hypothetical protein [Candidatus Riflebacteria bacterium]